MPDASLRLLGVDPGTKRIGLAVASADGFPGRALATIVRSRRLGHDLDTIVRVAREQGAHGIVVGLPRNADGAEGDAARRAREFGAALRKVAPIPVVFHDEYGTTVAAETELILANVPLARRRALVDQWAAVHLLAAFFSSGASLASAGIPE